MPTLHELHVVSKKQMQLHVILPATSCKVPATNQQVTSRRKPPELQLPRSSTTSLVKYAYVPETS
jgi:hypothetical protein